MTKEYLEVLAAARARLGDHCRCCTICSGAACGNEIPGPGCKGPGNTALRNYQKWQEIDISTDAIYSGKAPDISLELFGRQFSSPVFAAPIATLGEHYGPEFTDGEYTPTLLKAAYEYNSAAFLGDSADPEIMKMSVGESLKYGGVAIPTVKPWYRQLLFEKLELIRNGDVLACCMDIDGFGLPKYQNGQRLTGSKSVDELREIADFLKMPFIVKGVMTGRTAMKAIDAGASAIVVSNHGGRVQSGAPSTCEVLPQIARDVNGKIPILVDGGIRSGVDVFRALLLGADGVLIGRPILTMICGGGAEAYRMYMDAINAQLSETMRGAGLCSLEDIRHHQKQLMRK